MLYHKRDTAGSGNSGKREETTMKLTFMGAGSTVFSKNVIGDTMMCDEFHDMEVALYDINAERLE